MVKITKHILAFLIIAVSVAMGESADNAPSPESLLGTELTPVMIQALPHRDCSTPQNVFLGFLRSSLEGNIRDHLFYLTSDAKMATAGVADENEISDEKAKSVAETLKQDNYFGVRLEEFQAIPDMSPTQIVAVVKSSRGTMTVRERYVIGIVQASGQWKIATFNIDMIDRRPASP